MASENVNIKTNLDSSGAESGLNRLKAKIQEVFNSARRRIDSVLHIKRTETVDRKVTETVESKNVTPPNNPAVNGENGVQDFDAAIKTGKILGTFEIIARLFNAVAEKLGKLAKVYKNEISIFGGSADAESKAIGYTAATTFFKGLGNAASWAGVGAIIGTVVAPGIGTAVGAAIGGVIGLASSVYNNWLDLLSEDNENASKRLQEIQEGQMRQWKVQKTVTAASKAMERQIALRKINENLEDDKKDIDELVSSGNVDELRQINYNASQNVKKLTKKRNELEQALIGEASRDDIAPETKLANQAKLNDELGLVNARLTAAKELNAYATAGINTAKENEAKQAERAAKDAEKDAKRQAQLDKEAARQAERAAKDAEKDAKAEKKSEIARLRDEYKAKMDEYRDKTKEFNEQVSIREDYINLVNGIRDMVSSSFSQIGGSVGPQYEVLSRLGNNEENLLKKFKDDTTSKLDKIHEAAEKINNTIQAKQNEPAVFG